MLQLSHPQPRSFQTINKHHLHQSPLRTQYNNNNYNLPQQQSSLFTNYAADQYSQSNQDTLMQSDHSNNSWFSNGPLTPTSTTRAHHRESSLSSLGSAGPASPFHSNLSSTSNPEIYHDYQDYQQTSSKPLTPAHTPSQEHFLAPHYSHFYHNSNLPFGMPQDVPKGNPELMPAPEFSHSGRPSIASVATNDSPSTPPSFEEERQKHVYRNTVPKLDRTMTDIYADELYNPNFQITSAPQTSGMAPTVMVPPQNDIFSQRLQAANNQHLSASNSQTPLAVPSRERSPFRQGSPLAPTGNSFAPQQSNVRFGTATHMREQQKAEADARALQQQIARTSPNGTTPNTISPKDVDLVYHESEEDANTPLFPQPQRQSPSYRSQATVMRDQVESDDNVSQRSFGSMATTRRESSSAYSVTSQATPQQNSFNFTPPAVPGGVRRIPQQYPFVPQSRRQTSNLSSSVNEDFPSTLTSMDSSSSEYAPETSEHKKPLHTSADTGTYTCTYHGCTLRFDTPAKLQRHKREGHRNSAAAVISGEDGGMTSAAQRNSQAGPHKCERINPSTGKPCNTIFSRPYDLTRHEDTIHNARKQKVHCPICTEEKTFSRNDALTRHMRVVHPQYADQQGRRRRGGS